MKKVTFLAMLFASFSIAATAQEKVEKKEVKVSKTSTVRQKVHNTFSAHKEHNGVKVKEVKKVEVQKPGMARPDVHKVEVTKTKTSVAR